MLLIEGLQVLRLYIHMIDFIEHHYVYIVISHIVTYINI